MRRDGTKRDDKMMFPNETSELYASSTLGITRRCPGTASHEGHRILRTTCAGGRGMIQGEPPIDELLSEPIVWLMAQSDGVSLDELKSLCEAVREKLVRASAADRAV